MSDYSAAHGKTDYVPSAVVYNGGAIKNLPDDVAVEIPIGVEKDKISKGSYRRYVPECAFSFILAVRRTADG